MLLRTTLSNTKKFFQTTVENFKSFLSGGYQRLPKSSPCNKFPCGRGSGRESGSIDHDHQEVKYSPVSCQESGQITSEFGNDQKGANQGSRTTSSEKKKTTQLICKKDDQVRTTTKDQNQLKNKRIAYQGKRYYNNNQQQDYSSRTSTKAMKERERSTLLVAKKLKELEMLDNGNVEHSLDIEEVLHYYSRLTCPAYVDIVDQFFMDMYSELLNGQAQASIKTTSGFHSSRPPMLQRFGIK